MSHTEYAYTRYVADGKGTRVGTRARVVQFGRGRRLATTALAAVAACLLAAPQVAGAGSDEPDADAGPDAKPDAQPDAEPDAQPDAEPDAQPDAEADAGSDSGPFIPPPDPSDPVFDPGKLHQVSITVDPANLAQLENDLENRVPCSITYDEITVDNAGLQKVPENGVVDPLAGKPAFSVACRAGACPCPAIKQLPRITSSICSGLSPARSTAAFTATAPRSLAESDAKSPSMPPIGVRAALTMTMGSDMMVAPDG